MWFPPEEIERLYASYELRHWKRGPLYTYPRVEEKDLEEEGDSEVAVRPPDDDAALLAQHPEGVGPREGQSVKLAPSDEEETAVRVAVSVQWALTGTPLISINLDLRDSIATVQGVVSYALYKPGLIVDPQTLKIIHGERTLQATKTLAELSSELGHPPVLELGMVQEVVLRPGDRPRDVIPRPAPPRNPWSTTERAQHLACLPRDGVIEHRAIVAPWTPPRERVRSPSMPRSGGMSCAAPGCFQHAA